MNKTYYPIAAMAVLILLFAAACSAPAPTAAPQQQASAPTLDVQAPTEPPMPAPTTIQPAPQANNGGAQAPICQAASSCQALNAQQVQLECIKKVPYTNVLVPQGTKFETVDNTGLFVCNDTGQVVNGQDVITCRGKPLWSYNLKLTNAACGAGNLQTGTGQCQQGYGYDAAQQCCSPVTSGSAGFAMVTVNMAGCPEINNNNNPNP